LRIHPLVEELRVWGDKLPSSVLRAAEHRLKHFGLVSDPPISKQGRLSSVRATGKRFQPTGNTLGERVRCVRDALGIGGGYVELWEAKQGVLDTVKRRHLDLEIPAVAPLSASSACLVRSHATGRCPSCTGTGSVSVFDESLVVKSRSADPTGEGFLRHEALEVLRGMRKNSLLPFLKRMTAEGLWPAEQSFDRLGPDERNILMHGYWHRPGPGSFLKTPHSKPEEVSSWLRWDGLYRAVLNEVDRSKAGEWAKQVRATTRNNVCPVCAGTGLRDHTRAIKVGSPAPSRLPLDFLPRPSWVSLWLTRAALGVAGVTDNLGYGDGDGQNPRQRSVPLRQR
jgi:excinuclease UvrABC ATPase subunit